MQLLPDKNARSYLKMAPEVLAVNLTENSVTIRFHSESWISNPIGAAHGGVVSAKANIAMAGNDMVKSICHKAGHQLVFLSYTAFAENTPEKALFFSSGYLA